MMSRATRTDLIRICIMWVVLSAAGEILAAYAIINYPGTASQEGIVTSEAFFFLLRVAVPVLVLVMLIIVYAAIRFRVVDNDDEPSENQYRSSRAFPWSWVSISTVLNVLFIFHPGITGLESLWSLAAAATNPLEVDVVAKQWEWQFDYPAQKLKGEGQLVVPVDTPIRFVLRSDDVIHSFWVPAWGIKKAVIPGETRTLTVTPDRMINTETDPMARVQCSQICGAGHADMRAVVRVVSREDFTQWAARELQSSQENMGGMKMKMEMGGGGMKMDMNGGKGELSVAPDGTDGMQMPMNPVPDEGSGSMKMDMGGNSGMKMDMQRDAGKLQATPDSSGGMNMLIQSTPNNSDMKMDMGGDSRMKMDSPMLDEGSN